MRIPEWIYLVLDAEREEKFSVSEYFPDGLSPAGLQPAGARLTS
jgi:hypothetical protein